MSLKLTFSFFLSMTAFFMRSTSSPPPLRSTNWYIGILLSACSFTSSATSLLCLFVLPIAPALVRHARGKLYSAICPYILAEPFNYMDSRKNVGYSCYTVSCIHSSDLSGSAEINNVTMVTTHRRTHDRVLCWRLQFVVMHRNSLIRPPQ